MPTRPWLPIAAVLATLAVASAARADEVVRIAYIDPLSGSLAATGQLGEQHFRFAIDRVNASGAAGPGRRSTAARSPRWPPPPRRW